MRLVFCGDGAWAANSLRRIAARSWSVGAVVLRRRPSSDALAEAARDLGLPVLRPGKVNSPEFLEIVRSFGPDLNVSVSYDQIMRRPLKAGEAITSEDLDFKRPGDGIGPAKLTHVVGRRLRRDLALDEELEWNDLL